MTRISKRSQQLRSARAAKKVRTEILDTTNNQEDVPVSLGEIQDLAPVFVGERCESLEMAFPEGPEEFLDDDSSDDEELAQDPEELIVDVESKKNAFSAMIAERAAAENKALDRYCRGPVLGERQQRRKRAGARDLRQAACNTSSVLSTWIVPKPESSVPTAVETEEPSELFSSPWDSDNEEDPVSNREMLVAAQSDMERTLRLKNNLQGVNLTRHHLVNSYLNLLRNRQAHETRSGLAIMVARVYGGGPWLARRLVGFSRSWILSRSIENNFRGCHPKVKSWLNDENVEIGVRDYLAGYKGSESQNLLEI